MLLSLTNRMQGDGNFNVVDRLSPSQDWKSIALEYEPKFRDLVDVYFEVVYPIFPLFHIPSLHSRLITQDYLRDQSFFADIMAICALASARVRDGALLPNQWEPGHFREPSPEQFFAVVRETMPRDLAAMKGLDWMRTCALMALFGIQVGKIEIMHQYLGIYHSLVSMDSLHDEKNWPKDIGIVEIELRRRLFWSMYTLEVYSSIIWGSIIRCREAQCQVLVPSEVNDEFFSDAGYHPPNALLPSSTAAANPMCWLHGWNFAVELYRTLEHAMDDFHRRRQTNGFSPSDLYNREALHQTVVLDRVMSMYEQLPPQFKESKLNSMNYKGGLEDKFSFQAANITATLQLVRMILFTSEKATPEEKCDIARDLLDSFAKIPLPFLRAISSPLLHHLAGIGAILGSVIEVPISESSYMQVRNVLIRMADLLSNLEIGMSNLGAASRLRSQIENIDTYMATQRSHGQQSQSHPMFDGLPPAPTAPTTTRPEPNPNIDPSLQDAVNGFQAPAYDFANSMAMTTAEMAGSMVAQAPDGEFMRLPQEILEGWPFPMNISSGFAPPGPEQGPY